MKLQASHRASRHLMRWAVLGSWLALVAFANGVEGDELSLSLRSQSPTSPGNDRFHTTFSQERWKPEETAIIVCDVWDLHHSQNAVRRVVELCPRLNHVLTVGRALGATVIHSPSDCMAAYAKHPARQRAIDAPPSKLPDDIQSWCSRIPAEEQAVYPIDQSDGGDDDDPVEHAQWVKKLRAMGRDPGIPWKRQTDLLTIDEERDYISDRGDEVWSILESRGIKNVILTGVHTNMCVLGRPFGLRQMARNGKNVVLMRDLTDTMYNPRRWPYVSHFAGTDLVIGHIERFVCPTITSDQFLANSSSPTPAANSSLKPFRFAGDKRPHLAVVIAEDEYDTRRTLPPLARELLSDFRISLIYGSDVERNSLVGLESLQDADLLLLSVRRRTLPSAQLAAIRKFIEAGRPVVGIRTASHAFSLRQESAPAGLADWPGFDAQVFGGNYTNHYGNQLKSKIEVVDPKHSIFQFFGLSQALRLPLPIQHGSLYQVSPLAEGATVLLKGTVEGQVPEPVAWTYERPRVGKGGRSFYTSIGHPEDIKQPFFSSLLKSAIYWAAQTEPTPPAVAAKRYWDEWSIVQLPGDLPTTETVPKQTWLRCAVRLTKDWTAERGVTLEVPKSPGNEWSAWLNGHAGVVVPGGFRFDRDTIDLDDANLLVLRRFGAAALPHPFSVKSAGQVLPLVGKWQLRYSGDSKTSTWSNIPLPARYGASTDILFEPKNR